MSTRAHPVDMVFTRLCGLIPLYVLGLAAPRGISSLVAVAVILLGMIWGFFIHANVCWRFGPLEWLIATPGFHHWHHSNDGPAYVNKNYAALLPWVDRFFGTLYLPKANNRRTSELMSSFPTTFLGRLVRPFLISQRRTASQPAARRPHFCPTSISRPLGHLAGLDIATFSLSAIWVRFFNVPPVPGFVLRQIATAFVAQYLTMRQPGAFQSHKSFSVTCVALNLESCT